MSPQTVRWSPRALLAAAGLLAALAAPAPGAEPARQDADEATVFVLDTQLQARRGVLVAIDARQVTLQDESGRRTPLPMSQVLAVFAAAADADPAFGVGAVSPGGARIEPVERTRRRLLAEPVGFLETVAGERLMGGPVAAPAPDADRKAVKDAVWWSQPMLGVRAVPLDGVARIVSPAAAGAASAQPAPAPAADEVRLANGDQLTGFVLSAGAAVELEQAEKATLTLPFERVASITLANRRKRPSGAMAFLAEGSVVAVDAMTLGPDGLVLGPPGGADPAPLPVGLRAFVPRAERLVPLSSLAPTSQTPPPGRRFADPISLRRHPDDPAFGVPPALSAWDILLPGPMTVVYTLPADLRAGRLAFTASIDTSAAPWGDAVLIVSMGGRELARQRLNIDRPAAAVNVVLPASPGSPSLLTITLDPGEQGPIHDRVTLHRPLLLAEPPAPGR
ncbi:MAG: hypothetical protein IBJ11_03465 [Phycisphaerales bacterium]|nr:hypothetical protein [Phycisphaerales bacterium]